MLSLKKPVVLVGLMGSGKTTVGMKLANTLGVPFFDTDKEIEKNYRCSLADIFYYAGVEYFREAEYKVISNLLIDKKPKIIATGGENSFINPEIRDLVKENALSVWIKVGVDVIIERVAKRNKKLLLENGDRRNTIENLMNQRYEIYSEADIVIESDNKSHMQTVKMIVDSINNFIVNEKID